MGEPTERPVVVGVDGSGASEGAIRLAARFAASRALPLRLVHAYPLPLLTPDAPRDLGDAAQTIVNEGIEVARAAQPKLAVSGDVITGESFSGAPAAVLIDAARDASLLVVGERGTGGFARLLLGSVAVQVTSHAACPVVVSRGQVDREGPVVVGVDDSDPARRALAFAFDEADRRGVPLVAMHAYTDPSLAYPGQLLVPVRATGAVEEAQRALLDRMLLQAAPAHPGVAVTPRIEDATPAAALTDGSAEAGLVVVGTRGVGGFRGLALGSVAHAVMHHAECPVAVIR